MNGASVPSDGREEERELNRKIRKQIKNMLEKLLSKSLIADKREKDAHILQPISASKQERAESLVDCVNVYGILSNAVTKKREVIFGARTEHFQEGLLVFYTVDNPELFTSFPTAGTYQGPYTTNKGVFVEVLGYMNGLYICKPIDHIRYVELMSINKESR